MTDGRRHGNSSVCFRFYAELNDFLPERWSGQEFSREIKGRPSVKDAIEALGVPHTEIDLIVVNGQSVGFDHRIKDQDRIAVYPVFESIDISPAVHLRARPLRVSRFVLDTHLGKLARLMRMLGFDCLYRNDYRDEEIVRQSVADRRIILTRDRGLLKSGLVTHGYWVRSTTPRQQVIEVLGRLDLHGQIRPFTRCMVCNGRVTEVAKQSIEERLLPKTRLYYTEFYICPDCDKVYWKGSHYQKLAQWVAQFKSAGER
jgi:uncharacterized protein with PIN domain